MAFARGGNGEQLAVGIAGHAGCSGKNAERLNLGSVVGASIRRLPDEFILDHHRCLSVHPAIGRAPCRDRVGQYVWISEVAVSLKQKRDDVEQVYRTT